MQLMFKEREGGRDALGGFWRLILGMHGIDT